MSDNSKVLWDPSFGPSYNPEQMLKMGVFEGKYINVIQGLPEAWYNIPKVLKKTDDPDPSINYYKVKSRQPLSVWKKNGWTDPDYEYGWFHWYCLYYLGRRLGEKDELEINRWRSFVARHQGQIKANCNLNDKNCRPKQRQALLQWGWGSSTLFNDQQVTRNARKLARSLNVGLEDSNAMIVSLNW